jgi:SAM-dependent methyltransferase
VISERLLSVVCCPDCRASLVRAADGGLTCTGCGRAFGRQHAEYLDLRPAEVFRETTKYVDEALHADARHESVSPPLLSAAIRNDMLRAFLAPGPDDRVIDLGCGSGRALVWNQDRGSYLVGTDVSPFFAHEALAHVDLVIADLRALPFKDGAFTKAFSLDVAEHLSRESLTAMLKEACRILEPGGQLFLYTHVRKGSPLAFFMRSVNRVARALDRAGLADLRQERLRKSDHINPLADIPDLAYVTGVAGFRIARLRYYTPIIGSVVENILLRLGEGYMARRASARASRPSSPQAPRPSSPQAPKPSSPQAPKPSGPQALDVEDFSGLKAARLDAKRRIAKGGMMYRALQGATWLMKLDVVLLGRFRSGPFFALLEKM